MSEIDTANRQLVGRQGNDVVVAMPRTRMSPREALVHAAWLVVVAYGEDEFPQVLEAVQNGE